MADHPIHQLKTCTKCGEDKLATLEHFDTYRDRGIIRDRRFCRICLNERSAAYRAANPEKAKEWGRRNTVKNKAPGSNYQKRKYQRVDKVKARESLSA